MGSAAYAADPQEFAALQDGYSYNNYYKPVERLLASTYGVDISGRADCVKGLAWGMYSMARAASKSSSLRPSLTRA